MSNLRRNECGTFQNLPNQKKPSAGPSSNFGVGAGQFFYLSLKIRFFDKIEQ
jgi:hypothetical protein